VAFQSNLLPMASIKTTPSQLYEHDYYAWVQDQVLALREHRTEEVDWENVAEEIDDLGKSVTWSVESHLETLVEQLLKLTHTQGMAKARNARLWEGTVRLARFRIRRRLAQNPSLRSKLPELLADGYRAGQIRALATMKLPEDAIPGASPWTLEQVLDDSFWPHRQTEQPE
jgi:hypothetical protein